MICCKETMPKTPTQMSFKDEDPELIKAFEDFVIKETNWNIYQFFNKGYVGKTLERWLCFKAGYLRNKQKAGS